MCRSPAPCLRGLIEFVGQGKDGGGANAACRPLRAWASFSAAGKVAAPHQRRELPDIVAVTIDEQLQDAPVCATLPRTRLRPRLRSRSGTASSRAYSASPAPPPHWLEGLAGWRLSHWPGQAGSHCTKVEKSCSGSTGLGNVAIHTGLLRADCWSSAKALAVIARIGMSCHPGRARMARVAQAVEVRHLDIHQHQVVVVQAGHLERFAAILGHIDGEADAVQQFDGHFAVDGIVLSEQHARAATPFAQQPLFGLGRRARRLRQDAATLQPGGEPEGAALAGHAVGTGIAAHQFGQVPGDDQAQPLPPYWRVVDASAWVKDWNSWDKRSASMPIPVSLTEKRMCSSSPSAASSLAARVMWPCSENLRALLA